MSLLPPNQHPSADLVECIDLGRLTLGCSPCWTHAHRRVHFAAAEWGAELRRALK